MKTQSIIKVIVIPSRACRYETVLLAVACALDNGQQSIISSPAADISQDLHASFQEAGVSSVLMPSGGAKRTETARRFHAGEISVMIVTVSDRLSKLWSDGQRVERVDLDTFSYATSFHHETIYRRLTLGELRFREWHPRIVPTAPVVTVHDLSDAMHALTVQSPTSAAVAMTRVRGLRQQKGPKTESEN